MQGSLADYTKFVDASLRVISNNLKSKISSIVLSKQDLEDSKLNYSNYLNSVTALMFETFNSEEVLKFKSENEKKLGMLSPEHKQNAMDYTNDQVKQLMNVDIDEHALARLHDARFENHLQETVKNPQRPSSHNRSYDQVVKGDCTIIKIKNNNNYSHKIIFHKIGKFLMYQVFDPKGIVPITHLPVHPNTTNHPREYNEALRYIEENQEKVVTIKHEINKDRDVNLKNGKEWVSYFNSIPGFTPTTVMEIGYDRYIFVIKKTKLNKNNKVIFYISTKEIRIENKLKKMIKIPTGNKYKNVRFDIDAIGDQSVGGCQGGITVAGISRCYCPNGSIVTSMGAVWIDFCMDECGDGYDTKPGLCWKDNFCEFDCTNSGGTCWNGWTPCTNPRYAGYTSYVPTSRLWVEGNGYYCNTIGDNYSQLRDGNCLPLDEKARHGPQCWLANNSSKYCCVEKGDEYCCPPGSSCTPPTVPRIKVTINNNNYNPYIYSMKYVKDNIVWDPDLNYGKDPPIDSVMIYTFYANNNNSTDITIDGNDVYNEKPDYLIQFLCIGGGAGAAASNNSGGGGAGGFRTSYPTSTRTSGGGSQYEEPIKFKNKKTYTITVGNGSNGIVGDGRKVNKYPYGGAPSVYDMYTPETVKQGFPSSIIGDGVNIISYGGSPGCCNKSNALKPDDYINKEVTGNQKMAGCGGGSTDANFGTGSQGQGYNGGKGSNDGLIGGGGGGAGGKGVDGGADQSIAGNGGNGIGSDISGTYTLYAGGGSGSSSRTNYPLKLLGGTADPTIDYIADSKFRPGGNGGGNIPENFDPKYFPPNFSTDFFNIGAEGRSNTGSGGGAGCKGSTDNPPGEYGLAYGGDGAPGIVILRIPTYSKYS